MVISFSGNSLIKEIENTYVLLSIDELLFVCEIAFNEAINWKSKFF